MTICDTCGMEEDDQDNIVVDYDGVIWCGGCWLQREEALDEQATEMELFNWSKL